MLLQDLLRHGFYAARPGSLSELSSDAHQHAKHCIDYLRQVIMCAADGTLEPGDDTTRHITGMNVVHECRDYDEVRRWSEEQRLTDEDVAKWSAPT